MIVKPKEIKFLGYLCVVVHYELYRLTIHDLSVISYYILHVSITRISHLTGIVIFLTALLMIMELRIPVQLLPSKHKLIIARVNNIERVSNFI